MKYDNIIIGSGPAGLTSAIFNVRACISTLVVTGSKFGGQITQSNNVLNIPGFIGIAGIDFTSKIKEQIIYNANLSKTRVDFLYEEVDSISFEGEKNFKIITKNNNIFFGKSVIYATGSIAKKIKCKGLNNFFLKTVFTCPLCESHLCYDKKVVIVGGGNTGLEAAIYLSKIAKEISIVHKNNTFNRADQVNINKVYSLPNVKFFLKTEIDSVEEKKVLLKNKEEIDYNIMFLCIGSINNLNVSKEIFINKDGSVYPKYNGIFMAGEVLYGSQQVVESSYQGYKAFKKVKEFINE